MNEKPINLETVLEQAPKWTFAGDFTLLQWMQQISQDLERRATKTSEALTKLNNNIKSTNIALDNVANRLTTLQFGNQFVESRVQDDDETLISNIETSSDNQNFPEAVTVTSKELLTTFLDNNLKILRNCYEKYSIDLQDSDDDDDNGKEQTCIYQPINPYNDRPLPFIFGSKDWHSKWHVGLYENQQENSYSGDELSEAFSQSSSTSHLDDIESFESNTEWVSSNSIDNDNLNANVEVKNASSLRGSQPIYRESPIPITAANNKAAISESSSASATSSLTEKPLQIEKPNASLMKRSESISSICSKKSSKTKAQVSLHSKNNNLQHKTETKKIVDLFAEPLQDQESKTSSSKSSTQNLKNSTEDTRTQGEERPSVFSTHPPPPFVDLFAEPPEDVISSTSSSISSSRQTKRKTVNLFDDDKTMTRDDILSVSTKQQELEKSKNKENSTAANKPVIVPKISKSLFDDSDDDDDFLKAFVKKSSLKEAKKSSLTKTLLFDDDNHEPTISSRLLHNESDNYNKALKTVNNKVLNIFDDAEENKDDILFSKTKIPKIYDIPSLAETNEQVKKLSDKEETLTKPANIFDDKGMLDVKNSHKTSTKINLFDDFDDDDNDLFSPKLKKNAKYTQPSHIKPEIEKDEQSFVNTLKNATAAKGVATDTPVKKNLMSTNDLHVNEDIPSKDSTTEHNSFSETINSKLEAESVLVYEKQNSKEKLVETANQDECNRKQKELKDTQETINLDKSASVAENITHKPSSTKNYEFNSVLFLDEPPEDDDAFFETLTKTSNTLNSNYNAIDLENDIYEPELPKVPAATNNNQADTTENFYMGLQLFNDIPPDDDASGSDAFNPTMDAVQTKRLHSVFYDDFSETLMALNQQHTEEDIPNHSIFPHEPPLINQALNSFSKDMIDHKVPDDKQEIIKHELPETVTKHEEANYKNTSEYSNKRPVSKLQMPQININVQALLPGANNTLRKAKENNSIISPSSDAARPEPVGKNEVIAARTAETEHILPNVTKNRVKAPSTRRPSTRRARQENYRKSLIEHQQETLESSDEKNEILSENAYIVTMQEEPKNSLNVQNQNLKDPISDNIKTNSTSNVLFQNNHQNDADFINTAKYSYDTSVDIKNIKEDSSKNVSLPQNIQYPTSSLLLTDDSLNNFDEIKTHKNKEEEVKFTQKTSSLLFDDDDEDDDFFKHIKTSNKITKSRESYENTSMKPPLKASESNVSIPSVLLGTTSTAAQSVTIAKEIDQQQENAVIVKSEINTTKRLTTNKFNSFFDDVDDEDDLFQTTSQQSTSSIRILDKNSKAKSQFKSFLDSETDEEPTPAGPQTTISTQTTTVSSIKNPNVSMPITKNSNAKLFTDSETDSDDLFGKSSNKTSIGKISKESTLKSQNRTQPQSSLFEDETDSDEFFTPSGSANKHTTSKSALKKNVPKATKINTTSIFGDLESDEDDLFGGGSAKVTLTDVSNAKTSSISQSTDSSAVISKSKTLNDNPLADLL